MTETNNTQIFTESISSQPSSPIMSKPGSDKKEEPSHTNVELVEKDMEPVMKVIGEQQQEEEEFCDAINDIKSSSDEAAHNLSNIITALQDTAIVNIPAKQEPLLFPEGKESNQEVLDTIPEDSKNNSPLFIITGQESPTQKKAADNNDDEFPSTTTTTNNEQDIKAVSEPSSPHPTAADVKITSHFEQIRKSIDMSPEETIYKS
ncbi:uncharacterized protein BX663DRAFT_268557 [Cokeromyces recurvatus]|uniref:uncharacterized protein n=1 Tax=Cokeromyces recurvatus TaxID=90255 RepID=UPI002220CAEF|nr:uncharacterized protein BX663DRAFT_268557 [Cokeromyces recurvatus]KAI7898153.1 hypothetical protein BX663DRAFT_268557 [Cokeromyces recurvatus]